MCRHAFDNERGIYFAVLKTGDRSRQNAEGYSAAARIFKYRLGIDRYGKAVPADIIRNRLHKIAFQNGLALIPRRGNGDG